MIRRIMFWHSDWDYSWIAHSIHILAMIRLVYIILHFAWNRERIAFAFVNRMTDSHWNVFNIQARLFLFQAGIYLKFELQKKSKINYYPHAFCRDYLFVLNRFICSNDTKSWLSEDSILESNVLISFQYEIRILPNKW